MKILAPCALSECKRVDIFQQIRACCKTAVMEHVLGRAVETVVAFHLLQKMFVVDLTRPLVSACS